MFWLEIIVVLAVSSFLIWSLYRKVKNDPQAFSKENMSKSFYSMGILALLLIILIAFCVIMLKSN